MTARQNKIYYIKLVEILDMLENEIESAEYKKNDAFTDYLVEMYADEMYALSVLKNTIESKC